MRDGVTPGQLFQAQLPSMRSALSRDAATLGEDAGRPLEVIDILRSLGLGFAIESVAKRSHDGILRKTKQGWEVVVARQSDRLHAKSLSQRERFTVAHEVAHYLIEARFGFRPRSPGEYWRIEDVCNEFAASLLIPNSVLVEALDPTPEVESDLLRATHRLTKSSKVSTEVAARRLLEASPIPFLMAGITIGGTKTPGSVGQLMWRVQSFDAIGVGSKGSIRTGDTLAGVVQSAHARAEGDTWSVDAAGQSILIERLSGKQMLMVSLLAEPQAVG